MLHRQTVENGQLDASLRNKSNTWPNVVIVWLIYAYAMASAKLSAKLMYWYMGRNSTLPPKQF